MLDFETYYKVCDYLEEQIKQTERKICYRSICLIGRNKSMVSPFVERDRVTEEEEKAIKADLEFQRLQYELNELRAKLNFIKERAELPREEDLPCG